MVTEEFAPQLSPLAWRHDRERDIAEIATALAVASVAEDPSLSEIAGHFITANTSRPRPEFVLASGLVNARAELRHTAANPLLTTAAVSIELVHLGTMFHDDVIGGATTRHGIETVNKRWGNLKAILAGDFLLARASELAASLSTDIAELLAETIAWCCEGQIRELQSVNDIDRNEEMYLEAIAYKTASLFATACRIGAMVAELDAETTDQLTEFGRSYGMAFQIIRDLADLTGAAAGVYTLPVIRHLAGEQGSELRELLHSPNSTSSRRRALEVLSASPVIASCAATAAEHIEIGNQCLGSLRGDPAVDGLILAARNLITSTDRALPWR